MDVALTSYYVCSNCTLTNMLPQWNAMSYTLGRKPISKRCLEIGFRSSIAGTRQSIHF